jgi:hypothetical protein
VRRIMLLYHALRNDDTDEDERRTESAPAAKGT